MRSAYFVLFSLLLLFLTAGLSIAETVEEYYTKAGESFQKGNYKESIELYTKAIELNPDIADAYNNRAAAEVKLKRYEAALKDYDKAIELSPDFPRAYFGRGLTKIIMFNMEEGCNDLFKARDLGHPDTNTVIDQYCKGLEPESK